MSQCDTHVEGDTATVILGGEVDLSWSTQVRREVLDALTRAPKVAIDLSRVSYIDSSGIAALVEGFQNARGKGQSFELVRVSPAVLAVLKLARLDRVFTLRSDDAT
ncbi:MAG TPA: STAS domain-containing protein [Chiayiivirga sp.]|nr:STAS domain-containing protein [Chiayiivirga sp.]